MEQRIKTIDIIAKQWFDKNNGNSYFAAIVTINYKLEGENILKLPFQYGYGDYYYYAAIELVKKEYQIDSLEDIIIRRNIQRGCKKRDLKNFVL